ncbi:dihydrofolate reductase family protein [Microbacterium gorillae]|uniref:dihydrofolate reductase family protein n=1 Tax=Microbacterium gorillae TaxID=1231063 RepID=UPI00058D40F3|nr:dihydrofolate reductase family protein [Microbacterium gorillae]
MAKIIVTEGVTLDGVMQSPGRADEDTRGGFSLGGWAAPYADESIGRFMGPAMQRSTGMLLGRRTYEDLLHHWTAGDEPNPFRDVFTNAQKYVVSRSADTVLAYPNSTLLAGEAAQTVAELVSSIEGSLTVLGSGELVQALRGARLIDGYVLQIHPLILGTGMRLFEPGDLATLTLERSEVSTSGVLLAEYAVAR